MLGALDVLAHQAHGAARASPLRSSVDQSPVLGVRVREHLARGARSERSGRSSAPGPRSSPRPAGASSPPRRCRCGSACRPGGTPRTRSRRPSSRPARRGARAGRPRPARPPGSWPRPRPPPGSRAPPRSPRRVACPPARPAAAVRRRTCPRYVPAARRGDRSGPASSAPGEGSSARFRAVRPGSRSGGRRLPAGSRPRRIAVPKPLDRLLERGRGPHRLEHRLQRGVTLHAPKGTSTSPNRERGATHAISRRRACRRLPGADNVRRRERPVRPVADRAARPSGDLPDRRQRPARRPDPRDGELVAPLGGRRAAPRRLTTR